MADVQASESHPPMAAPARASVIAIASGRPGVGKTNIATNLAIALRARGHRVCVLDADARPTTARMLAHSQPRYTLDQLVAGEASEDIDDLLADGPGGLRVLPGAAGIADLVSLEESQRKRLVSAMEHLERRFDYLLIDTAAGVRNTVLYFLQAAQHVVMVITPDPRSLSSSFALAQALARRGRLRPTHALVNMVHDYTESREVFRRFAGAMERYLKVRPAYLGFIQLDETVTSSVELQRPVILLKHRAPASRCFYELAVDLIKRVTERPQPATFSRFWRALEVRAQGLPQPGRTAEFMRPPAPVPSVEAPAAPLSRHSLSEQAIAVLREPQSDAEGAQAFLEPLIDAYVERFARYPFDIREIVLKDLALRDHPSAEIRHLVSSLEASYEAHHHKPVHGIETTLVRVFQQAAQEPERIPGLIEQLRRHYRTTTGKEAIDLDREILEQTRNGELDQEAMESTISAMAQVYEQRFGQQVPGTGGVEADVVRGVLRELVTQQRNMVSGLETLLDRLESR